MIIRILTIVFLCINCPFIIYGEVFLDGTLGESKTLQGPNYQVTHDMGKMSGSNLFHSFEKFNINTNESAMFTGPDSIENIISRVTGGESSWIDGLIRSEISNANFYLINPSGITMGPNASIDIDGSFHISTADHLTFNDGLTFYTNSNHQSSFSSEPPSSFGFSNDNPSGISIEGELNVSDNQILSAVGGVIEIKSGSRLNANRGTINLIGIRSAGNVKLLDNGPEITSEQLADISITNAAIDISGNQAGRLFIRGADVNVQQSTIDATTFFYDGKGVDIQVANLNFDQSRIIADSKGDGKGAEISIQTIGNVIFINEAYLQANTNSTGDGGDVAIHAGKDVLFSGENSTSYIQMDCLENSDGDVGTLNIGAQNVKFLNGSVLQSDTKGNGDGGNLNIIASETVLFKGKNSQRNAFISIDSKGNGNAGGLYIQAKNISFENDTFIQSNIYGAGDGNLIKLNAENISFYDGSSIRGLIYGDGDGGNINLMASDDILFDGRNNYVIRSSRIYSACVENSTGSAGEVNLQATNILFNNDAHIDTATRGRGKGGDINIVANNLNVSNGSHLVSASLNTGDAGDINIKVSENVIFDGSGLSEDFSYIKVDTENIGNSGHLIIQAKQILFDNGALIQSDVSGQGSGSNIQIKVEEDIIFSGASRFHLMNQSTSEKPGKGSSLNINSNNIKFIDGSYIAGTTEGTGKIGEIQLNASENILFKGEDKGEDSVNSSRIYSFCNEGSSGDAGVVELMAKNISFELGAYIWVSTKGAGKGGELYLNASEKIFFSGKNSNGTSSNLFAKSLKKATGDGGNIWIEANNIEFREGSNIDVDAYSSGHGGNINIKAFHNFTLLGRSYVQTNTRSISSNAGHAGDILVEAKNITLLDGAYISSSTLGDGYGGSITINAEDLILLSGQNEDNTGSRIMASCLIQKISDNEYKAPSGNGGSIEIFTKNITLNENAYIDASTQGQSNAGNISIHATGTIHLSGASKEGEASTIKVGTYSDYGLTTGNSGSIEIEASNLFLENGATIQANTSSSKDGFSGKGGNIEIDVSGETTLSGVNPYGENKHGFSSGIFVKSIANNGLTDDAGSLILNSGSLSIINGAVISGNVDGKVSGGHITINIAEKFILEGKSSNISLFAPAESQQSFQASVDNYVTPEINTGIYVESLYELDGGGEGKVVINAPNIQLKDHAEINTSTRGGALAGNIQIETNQLLMDADTTIVSSSKTERINYYGVRDIAERDAVVDAMSGDIAIVEHDENDQYSRYVYNGTDWISIQEQAIQFNVYETNEYEVSIYHSELFTLDSLNESDSINAKVGDVLILTNQSLEDHSKYVFNGNHWYKLDNSFTIKEFATKTDLRFHKGDIIVLPDMSETGEITTFVFDNTRWKQISNDAKVAEQISASTINPLKGDMYQVNIMDSTQSTDYYVYDGEKWNELSDNFLHYNEFIIDLFQQSEADYTIIQRYNRSNGNIQIAVGIDDRWVINDHEFYNLNDLVNKYNIPVDEGYQANLSYFPRKESSQFVYDGNTWFNQTRAGNAGSIDINASKLVKLKGPNTSISTSANGGGKAGDIQINTADFLLSNNALVSSASNAIAHGGATGTISINAAKGIRLMNNSFISAQAINTVRSFDQDDSNGQISIRANELVYLEDSDITTSIQGGSGNGGDISIDPEFVILNNSNIIANAYEGDGGNIDIVADYFIQSVDSTISASSEKGIDGIIDIDSPDIDVTSGLTVLPVDYMDVSKYLHSPCESKSMEDISSFVVRSRDALPTPMDDLRSIPSF